MSWLAQNGIWIVVLVAVVVLLLSRRGNQRYGMIGHHGYGYTNRTGSGGLRQRIDVSRSPPNSAIDPVSGNAVDTARAVTAYYSGRVFFFESEVTHHRFEADRRRMATGVSEAEPMAPA